jgi:head-tail adaptor
MPRFDKPTAEKFLVAIRAGASNENAAQHAEIPLATIREWLKGDTKTTAAFRRDVEKARADLELLAIGTVRRNMAENDQNAKWLADKVRGDAELERLRSLTT